MARYGPRWVHVARYGSQMARYGLQMVKYGLLVVEYGLLEAPYTASGPYIQP